MLASVMLFGQLKVKIYHVLDDKSEGLLFKQIWLVIYSR